MNHEENVPLSDKLMNDGAKVLFISYHFPPDTAVGAIRPGKFVKYLSRRGFRPYVLTIQEKHIRYKEDKRAEDVSHVPIFRTEVWPTFTDWLLGIRRRIFGVASLNGSESGTRSEAYPEVRNNSNEVGLFNSLERLMISIFEMPDRQIGWFLPAVWKGYWLIRRERIRLIVASSPPRSVSLIGLFLSRITGATLVTDWRDPWFVHGCRPAGQRSWLSDKIEAWLELKIVEGSEKVIVTTDNYRGYLAKFYSHLSSNRFHTIWNGYDAEDFRGLEFVRTNKKLTFSYVGTFYLSRSPKLFLKALKEFMTEQHVDESQIEVNFVGDVRNCGGERLEEMIKSHPLSACVKISDAMPYAQALALMKMSHVLLLYTTKEQYYGIPAKTFEYIAVGRTILCFSEGGATTELISKFGAGIVVKLDDVKVIKSAIQQLYWDFSKGELDGTRLDVSMFERDALTRQLATLLQGTFIKKAG